MKHITLPFIDTVLLDKKSDNIIINKENPEKKCLSFSGFDSYCSILEDNNKKYLYYRKISKICSNTYPYESTHCIESDDGGFIFNKNNKEIFKLNGLSHNFCIINKVIDNKYKGIGGVYSQACSTKGIQLLTSNVNNQKWEIEKKIILKSLSIPQKYFTYFDSLNNIFYDDIHNNYRIYTRYNKKIGDRRSQTGISKNLESWSKMELCNFDYHSTNIYIPAVVKYPNSPLYLSFSNCQIKTNKKSNKVFLSYSFDGINFICINEKLFKDITVPHRPVPNIIESNDKFNIYVDYFEKKELYCYQVRKDGFLSIGLNDDKEGFFIIKSMEVGDSKFYFNFKTIKNGYVKIRFFNNNSSYLTNKIKGDFINYCIDIKNKIIGNEIKIEIIFKSAKIYSISLKTYIQYIKNIFSETIKKKTLHENIKKVKSKIYNLDDKQYTYKIRFEYHDLLKNVSREMEKDIKNDDVKAVCIEGPIKYLNCHKTAQCNLKLSDNTIKTVILMKSNEKIIIDNIKVCDNKITFINKNNNCKDTIIKYFNYLPVEILNTKYTSYNYVYPSKNKNYNKYNCGRIADCEILMNTGIIKNMRIISNSKSNCIIKNYVII